jgi:hypothetical protein
MTHKNGAEGLKDQPCQSSALAPGRVAPAQISSRRDVDGQHEDRGIDNYRCHGEHDSEADSEAVGSERTGASAEGGKERGGDHRDAGCRQQEQAADPGKHGIRAPVPGNTPGDIHQVLYCLCHAKCSVDGSEHPDQHACSATAQTSGLQLIPDDRELAEGEPQDLMLHVRIGVKRKAEK